MQIMALYRGNWPSVWVVIILSLALVVGVSSTFASGIASGIAGSYTHIRDSDGTTPKPGATVTITFDGDTKGTLNVLATQPGETFRDSGTYAISGNRINLNLKELELKTNSQPFQFDGCTLVLPFQALSSNPGPGTSTWQKNDPVCGQKPLASTSRTITREKVIPQELKPLIAGKKACRCKNIKDVEFDIAIQEYIADQYNMKAEEYKEDSEAVTAQRGFVPQMHIDKQIENFISWKTNVLIPNVAKKFVSKSTDVVHQVPLTPHPKKDYLIDKEALRGLIETAACRELLDAFLEHERHHFQFKSEQGKMQDTAELIARDESESQKVYLQELNKTLEKLKKECGQKTYCPCPPDKPRKFATEEECKIECPMGVGPEEGHLKCFATKCIVPP